MAVKFEPIIDDRLLRPIYDKVLHNQRLSFDDGVTLYRTSDLLAVGFMANLVRERLHGNVTYFNVNRHINPTDVCVASCKLCAFGKKARDPKAYTMSLDQVYETAGKGWTDAVSEFHIVGGLHPELSLDWFCEMLRGLKERFHFAQRRFGHASISVPQPRAHIGIHRAEVMFAIHYEVRVRKRGIDGMGCKLGWRCSRVELGAT